MDDHRPILLQSYCNYLGMADPPETCSEPDAPRINLNNMSIASTAILHWRWDKDLAALVQDARTADVIP